MKVSKGQSQLEIVADIRLFNSLHGSGFTILYQVLIMTHMSLGNLCKRASDLCPSFWLRAASSGWQLACESRQTTSMLKSRPHKGARFATNFTHEGCLVVRPIC